MRLAAYFLILEMLMCMGGLAQTKKTEEGAASSPLKLERMPEALEIRFALSAAPPHLRDNATTYVLDPAKGYVLSHRGTNGVSCIVVRSDWQFPNQPFRGDVFLDSALKRIDLALPDERVTAFFTVLDFDLVFITMSPATYTDNAS